MIPILHVADFIFFFVRKFERNSTFGNFRDDIFDYFRGTERTNLAVTVLVGCTCLVTWHQWSSFNWIRLGHVIQCYSCDWLKRSCQNLIKADFFRYRVSLFSCLCVFCLVTYTGLEPYTRHVQKHKLFRWRTQQHLSVFVTISGSGFGHGLNNYIEHQSKISSPKEIVRYRDFAAGVYQSL